MKHRYFPDKFVYFQILNLISVFLFICIHVRYSTIYFCLIHFTNINKSPMWRQYNEYKIKLEQERTWEINGPTWFFNLRSFPKPFSATEGNDNSRKVWPVGAVSNTTTEKFILFTSLKDGKLKVLFNYNPKSLSPRMSFYKISFYTVC